LVSSASFSPPGIEKPPEDSLFRGPLNFLFWHFNYTTKPVCKSMQKRANFICKNVQNHAKVCKLLRCFPCRFPAAFFVEPNFRPPVTDSAISFFICHIIVKNRLSFSISGIILTHHSMTFISGNISYLPVFQRKRILYFWPFFTGIVALVILPDSAYTLRFNRMYVTGWHPYP